MAHKQNVVIVGGGVIGATTAYYLLEKGFSVSIVEKETFGCGASHGNCGLIVPTHVLPLNTPGNLVKGLRWMLKKDAPLFIKPGLNPDLFKWLLKFAGHCTHRHMFDAASGCAAMIHGAIDDYAAMLEKENLRCDWEHRGVLHLFNSPTAFKKHQSHDALIRQFTFGARPLGRDALVRLEPAVGEGVVGAWFDEAVAHLRPDTLMAELKRVLSNKGVTVVEGTEVKSFRVENGRAVAAETDRGSMDGAFFVVATGAWTPFLGRALGCHIPIQPGKGYSVTLDRPPSCPTRPCFFEEAGMVATPWNSGLRLGGTMEFSGYDPLLNRPRLRALYRGARRYLGSPVQDGVQEEWCGWRPMTHDGLPVIDTPPGLGNLVVAAGHNTLGLTMAQATGKLVADIFSGDTPHIDPRPYRMDRWRTGNGSM